MGRFLLLTHFLLSISASLTVLRPRPPPGSEQSVPREVQDGAHRLPQGLWTRASEWIHTWTVMSVNIFLSDSSSLVLLLFLIFLLTLFFFSIYYFPSTLVVVKALHQDTVLLPVVLLMHMISIYQALIDSLAFGWLTAHHFGWCSSWTWLSFNNLFVCFFSLQEFHWRYSVSGRIMFCFCFFTGLRKCTFEDDIIVWGESRGQVEENLEGQQEQVRL